MSTERAIQFEVEPSWDFNDLKTRNKMQGEIIEALGIYTDREDYTKDKRGDWAAQHGFKLRELMKTDPDFLASVGNHDWDGAREALIRAGGFRDEVELGKWDKKS